MIEEALTLSLYYISSYRQSHRFPTKHVLVYPRIGEKEKHMKEKDKDKVQYDARGKHKNIRA